MALSDSLKQAMGTVAKAKILIADDRTYQESLNLEDAVSAKSANQILKGESGKLSQLTDLAARTGQQKQLEEMARKGGGAEYEEYKKKLEAAMAASQSSPIYDKSFTVQFNPSSLKINSYEGGANIAKINYSGGRNQITKGAVPLHVEMGVQLLFDQMSATDSFVGSRYTTVTHLDVATKAALKKAYKKIAVGSRVPLQTEVEGFTAALRDPHTRGVKFCWGPMEYAGVLRQVVANYTMFDLYGRPVRATVDLQIYLRDESVTATDMGYWEEAYERAFGGSRLLDTTRVGQGVTGFLNMGV